MIRGPSYSSNELSFTYSQCSLVVRSDQVPELPDDWFEQGFHTFMPNYYKPAVPCSYCASRGLDCKVLLNEGNKVCFACISLFRSCSFVDARQPNTHAVDTLHPVDEDAPVERGALTGIRKTYTAGASMGEIKAEMERRGRAAGDPPGGQASARFSKQIVRILKTWLDQHSHHPYPTNEEKEDLRARTGLSCLQISNWLANARRRGKVRPKRGMSPSVVNRSQPVMAPSNNTLEDHALPEASGSQPIEIPSSAPEGYAAADQTLKTPMERWRCSPPESEAPLTAIALAAQSREFSDNQSGDSSISSSLIDHRQSTSSDLSGFRAPSSTSQDTGESSNSRSSRWSLGSSRGSGLSYGSFARKERRRRCRRATPVPSQKSSHGRTDSGGGGVKKGKEKEKGRPFQCTFCVDTFHTKFDWMRHEKSKHLNLEKWICCPEGPVEPCAAGHTTICAYCRQPEPTAEHIESHDHSTCVEKGVNARTFLRKDHLRQHLRLVHHVKLDPAMEKWVFRPDVVHSRCGFCDATFDTWDDRAAHLAKHFRDGKQMGEWNGGWGFDPDVAACVTDAMPPYLIETERTKPLPWSAEKGETTMFNDLQMQHGLGDQYGASKGYEVMGFVLANYVAQCRQRGEEITDEKLQVYARESLFGSDDSWNQTRADDAQWLALFKKRVGLEDDGAKLRDVEIGDTSLFLAADLGLRGVCRQSEVASQANVPTTSAHDGRGQAPDVEMWGLPLDTAEYQMLPVNGTSGADESALAQFDFTGLDLNTDFSLPAQDQPISSTDQSTLDSMVDDMMWSMEGDEYLQV